MVVVFKAEIRKLYLLFSPAVAWTVPRLSIRTKTAADSIVIVKLGLRGIDKTELHDKFHLHSLPTSISSH